VRRYYSLTQIPKQIYTNPAVTAPNAARTRTAKMNDATDQPNSFGQSAQQTSAQPKANECKQTVDLGLSNVLWWLKKN
jgi:hypothetical protein